MREMRLDSMRGVLLWRKDLVYGRYGESIDDILSVYIFRLDFERLNWW